MKHPPSRTYFVILSAIPEDFEYTYAAGKQLNLDKPLTSIIILYVHTRTFSCYIFRRVISFRHAGSIVIFFIYIPRKHARVLLSKHSTGSAIIYN